MSVIINYTKKDYDAKITELQGYYDTLEKHLEKMNALKSQIFDFWNDENARKTGTILARMIQSVEFTMNQTNDALIFYRTCVDKFTGVNATIDDLLGQALQTVIGSIGGGGGGGAAK